MGDPEPLNLGEPAYVDSTTLELDKEYIALIEELSQTQDETERNAIQKRLREIDSELDKLEVIPERLKEADEKVEEAERLVQRRQRQLDLARRGKAGSIRGAENALEDAKKELDRAFENQTKQEGPGRSIAVRPYEPVGPSAFFKSVNAGRRRLQTRRRKHRNGPSRIQRHRPSRVSRRKRPTRRS